MSMVRFNEKNEVIAEDYYRAILAGIQLEGDITRSMDELSALAQAAGVEPLGQLIQKLEHPNRGTFLGKGKIEELSQLVKNMEADMVVFNDELSGMQIRNLEDILSVRVIDRTILILDIFASRATSREGKLQVELAQLQYRMPRLTGFGKSLSRLGGGIGTRGPGEKKLETDRRHIAGRVDEIKRELVSARQNRGVQRAKRQRSEIPVVALVGYTNSGKSALMNQLLNRMGQEDKTVLEKDMLFATLDTSQRRIHLEDTNQEFVLIDTVGFVSQLPHSLVEAFKSTLEEVNYADLLLHVVDASFCDSDFQMGVTNQVLKEIGAGDKDTVVVYNKMDLLDEHDPFLGSADSLHISALRGDNINELIEKIKERIFAGRSMESLLIPYDRGDLSSYLCEKCRALQMEYREEGVYFEVELTASDRGRLSPWITEKKPQSQV